MRKSDYRDLLVYQKGRTLCPEVYRLTRSFPEFEKFGLASQIQRAAVSIPANIAEGHGRSSDQEFVRFLYIAFGSVQELETLIGIAFDLEYIEEAESWHLKTQEIAKMLSSFISTLKARIEVSKPSR